MRLAAAQISAVDGDPNARAALIEVAQECVVDAAVNHTRKIGLGRLDAAREILKCLEREAGGRRVEQLKEAPSLGQVGSAHARPRRSMHSNSIRRSRQIRTLPPSASIAFSVATLNRLKLSG